MGSLRHRIAATGRVGPVRNLLAASEDISGWSGSATMSGPLGLNALGRFTGHALLSNGQDWHRNEMLALTLAQGDMLCTTLWLRPGSANALLFRIRESATLKSHSYSGALDALPLTAGIHQLIADTVLEDGVSRRITLRSTASFDGAATVEIGPYSRVAQQELIVLAAQVERGTHATAYQFRGRSGN